ncbi:MAG: protein kinase [Lachnospiraceae bacterium]|nr:protein kinase [Lachnospiraceae bacterium]
MSYYKPIAAINEPHHVYLVQHQETKKIAIKKVLDVYNLAVYAKLYRNPVAGTPRIINYCEETGHLTVIEEYISGTSLQDKISHTDIAPNDMLQYMLDLCAILEQLHLHNPAIIHRDVKPTNVIITSYNRAVLLDFNAAKYHTAAKDSDTILLGTQGYAAPEQYGFGQSSPQTDIYSMGILLKEMAEASHCQNPYICAVTAKCTQMNPAERYRSIGELRQALLANGGIFPYPHAGQASTGDLSGLSSNRSNAQTQNDSVTSANHMQFAPPGFRSKTPWKMAVALLTYIFLAWFCLSMKVNNTFGAALWVERVFALIMMLFIVASIFDYLHVRQLMPLCQHEKKALRIFGVVVLDILVVFGLIVVMAIVQSFCPNS